MRLTTKIKTGALAVAVALGVAAPAAHATSSTVRVAIANQSPDMFASAKWQALDLKRTRYFIRWNAAEDPYQLQQADQFVAAAKAAGVSVLMHISTDDYSVDAKLPTRTEYKREVGKLIARYYPQGVREWGVWNEANDRTQPTHRSPARAADFFKDMWGMLNDSDRCGAAVTGKCRIVALDVLDGYNASLYGNTRSFIRRFYARLSPTYDRRASVVGIHNYSDVNRHATKGTSNAIAEVRRYNKRARFWFTETGGVVRLGTSYRCSASSPASVKAAEARAARAESWMFDLTNRYRSSVDRLYVYQWTGSDCSPSERFDAGLVRRDGSSRPALTTLERKVDASKIYKP